MTETKHTTALTNALVVIEQMPPTLSNRTWNALMRGGMEQMVRSFHEIYRVQAAVVPTQPTKERLKLRLQLIFEEVYELLDATNCYLEDGYSGPQIGNPGPLDIDMVETADALADIVYVAIGMAVELGIPFTSVFREIHASNLTKLGEDGQPIINACQWSACWHEGVAQDCRDITHYQNPSLPLGKVIKGPNYVKANITRIINQKG